MIIKIYLKIFYFYSTFGQVLVKAKKTFQGYLVHAFKVKGQLAFKLRLFGWKIDWNLL